MREENAEIERAVDSKDFSLIMGPRLVKRGPALTEISDQALCLGG
jgi:hypothetical protein